MRKTAEDLDAALQVANQPLFNGGAPYTGYIKVGGLTGGRADKIDMTVPSGSYVIPADIVAGRGQGNTDAGALFWQRWLQSFQKAPYNAEIRRARGGKVPAGTATRIKASEGELVVSPEEVQALGKGDIERGHAILDALVKRERNRNVETLKQLPGPKK